MSDALDRTTPLSRDFESEPTLDRDESRTIPIEKLEPVEVPVLPRSARGTRPLPLAPPRAPTVPPPIPPHARRARPATAAMPVIVEPTPAALADDPPSVDEPLPTARERVGRTVAVHRAPLHARVRGWLASLGGRRGRASASAPVALPIASVPAGATVAVIADGEVTVVGQTPLAVALDATRSYEVVLALRDHATTLHQVKPHIAAALMIRLERRG